MLKWEAEITAIALRLFRERGYSETTVDDLAAALRLGVGEHTLSVLGNAEISDATASGVGEQSDAS